MHTFTYLFHTWYKGERPLGPGIGSNIKICIVINPRFTTSSTPKVASDYILTILFTSSRQLNEPPQLLL